MRPSPHQIDRLKAMILSLRVPSSPQMTIEDVCYVAEVDAAATAEIIARSVLEELTETSD
ncbi:MAG: hypothetical protein JWL84_5179 [Rhodospirillales bacterium]|nr:hypothetical protein [Rhodospirillales bacterium]